MYAKRTTHLTCCTPSKVKIRQIPPGNYPLTIIITLLVEVAVADIGDGGRLPFIKSMGGVRVWTQKNGGGLASDEGAGGWWRGRVKTGGGIA